MKWIRDHWPQIGVTVFITGYCGLMVWVVDRDHQRKELWSPTLTAESASRLARQCLENGGVPIIEQRTYPSKRRYGFASCDQPPFDAPGASTPPR